MLTLPHARRARFIRPDTNRPSSRATGSTDSHRGHPMTGSPPPAQYDTSPMRITQSKPGATILTTLSGWQYGSGYARLTVGTDGTAFGRLLPDTYSFMLARPHVPPPVDIGDTKEIDASDPRPAAIHPDVLHDWTAGFIAQLTAPAPSASERALMAARASTTTWTPPRALSPP